MNIFDLQATISLNGTEFRQGISEAQTAFSGLNSSVSAGAIAIGNILADMATKAVSALGDFAKSAIDTGMNFDASMANVKAISGATGEEFDLLRDKAKKMGATTKFTATEAADAFSYMAMAGWETEDMLDGISGIMNLAAASGESLATTSDIVTDALTAFGLTAEDSGHFADVLAAASSAANTNVGLMGETFKYVAPVAGSLKYSVEDVATGIGLMANAGIKGSQAGTALRSSLTRLVKPTNEVRDALDALGLIQLADDTGEFEYNMEDLEKEVSAVDKAQTALNEAINKYGAGSSQATAKAQKLAEAQSKLTSAMEAQRVEALSYNSAIVDAEGNVIPFSATIDKLRSAFSELTEAEAAEYASTIFGQEAMSGMLAIINASDEDYNKLAETIAGASDAIDGLGAAAAMAETQADSLSGRVTKFESAFDGFKLAIYDSFEAPLSNAVDKATEAISVMTQGFDDDGLRGALTNLKDFLKSSFDEMFPSIDLSNTKIGEFIEKIRENSGDSISKFAEKVSNLGSTFVSVSVETISNTADSIKEFIGAFDRDRVAEIIGRYVDGFAKLFGTFADAYNTTIKEAGNAINGFLDSFDKEGAANAITDVADSSSELFSKFTTSVSDKIRSITEKFDGFGTSLADLAAEFPIDTEKLGESISGLLDTLGKASERFNKFISPVTEFFENTIIAYFKGALEMAVGAFGGIVDSFSDLISFFDENVQFWINLLSGDFTGAWENIKNAWGSAGEFFQSVWKAIKGAFTGAKEEFDGIGKDLVDGLWEGFNNAWENFKEKVSDLVDGVIGIVKGIFQIGSPSKVFRSIGGFLVEGMEQGWASEFGAFEDEVSNTMSGISGTTRIGFDASSIGRSSQAQIMSTMTAGQGMSASPIEINVVLDGDVAARAMYDPLRRVAWQKGNTEAVHA